MKEIVKKNITYLGIDRPNSPIQVRMEISGLKHCITQAEEMIARLKQALAIMDLKREEPDKAQIKGEETTSTEVESVVENVVEE